MGKYGQYLQPPRHCRDCGTILYPGKDLNKNDVWHCSRCGCYFVASDKFLDFKPKKEGGGSGNGGSKVGK